MLNNILRTYFLNLRFFVLTVDINMSIFIKKFCYLFIKILRYFSREYLLLFVHYADHVLPGVDRKKFQVTAEKIN